jgi:uncharacterized protein DUF5686/carboxypeptidase-like protein
MIRSTTLIITLVMFIGNLSFAQDCRISGKISDAADGEALQFAHIWIKSLATGTTTDGDGNYVLTLPYGSYRIRASYMGYHSQKLVVDLSQAEKHLDFALKANTIAFPEIVVLPGENPAIPIIRKAIAAKRKVEENLKNYEVEAHTKLRVYDAKVDLKGISSDKLLEDGVLFVAETQTTAYWTSTGEIKEVIKARKQAVMEGEVYNLLNSMPARVNFSADDISFGNKDVTGPISEDGLDDYWYDLEGTTVYDDQKIYKIRVTPRSEIQPLVEGMIYIADSSYLLMLVDVGFNESVFGSMLNNVNFRQQFSNVDGYWMPTDVAIHAGIEVAAVVTFKFKVDLLSVLKNYSVNTPDIDQNLDGFMIEVAESADDIDSAGWYDNSFIPLVGDEFDLYEKSDSAAEAHVQQAKEYGLNNIFFGKRFVFDKTSYSVPGLLGAYRFNRIEGHALNLGFEVGDPFAPVEEIEAIVGYGFSDERLKWSLGAGILLNQYSGFRLQARAYDELHYLDEDSYQLNNLTALFAQAAFMWDPRDFFYRKGVEISLEGYIAPVIKSILHGNYNNYQSADVNTDEHLFRVNRPWRMNPPINDGYISSVGLRVELDLRSRILNKGAVQRVGRSQFKPYVDATVFKNNLDDGEFTYSQYSAGFAGGFGLGGWGSLKFQADGSYADNIMPMQTIHNIDGSAEGVTGPWLFRSFLWSEFGGDQIVTAMLHWDLGNMPFRVLGVPNIPYLNNRFWELSFFGNGGWTDIREETQLLQKIPVDAARIPFYELGFSIGNIFTLFEFDFAWRMNHFSEGHNFFWGISIAPGSVFSR